MRDNVINKRRFNSEQEYIDFVLSLKDKFPSVERLEETFEMTPFDEETNPDEYEGVLRPETMKNKPKRYPCIYVFVPLHTDDCRGFGGCDGWIDDFIYLRKKKHA